MLEYFVEFGILLFVSFVYGIIYSVMNPTDFGFKDKIDPYYFSFTTMSTVGYGDFGPKTRHAKLLVMSQQLLLLTGEITLLFKYIGK